MSHILSAEALSDFITPGVACIKPIETLPSAPPPPETHEHEVILDDGRPPPPAPGAPTQISLTDCLACSGCVTSAEAVLVSLQSHAEVLDTLDGAPALQVVAAGPDAARPYEVEGREDDARRLFVASVSPQARANLAAACGGGVTEAEAGRMLQRLLMGDEGLGASGRFGNRFAWVVDTNVAREACLVLGSDEVLDQSASAPSKPILTSSCPGWVCYAEKTHPHVLGHLSKVKSPQALTGTLLKASLSRALGIPPGRIWHLSIMPCFDKKLEASREELTDSVWDGDGSPGRGIRDVDCVITSKEILMLTESRGIDFFNLPASPISQQAPFPDPVMQKFLFPSKGSRQPSQAAGSSGGNLHFILQDALHRHPGSTLQATRGRNADMVEYVVNSVSGTPLLKAARYYGFRNIQNLVRRLKPPQPSRMPGGKPFGSARRQTSKASGMEYAYVEVMACPGGCNNGGGQIKVDDPIIISRKGLASKPGPQEQKEWLAQVDEAYFSADDSEAEHGVGTSRGVDSSPGEVGGISPSYIRDTLAHWAGITGIDLHRLVYTSYREVISDVGKASAGDADAVSRLVGKVDGGW